MSFIKKLFGGRTKREERLDKEYESAFLPLVKQGSEQGRYYSGLVAPTLARADATLKPVQDYHEAILHGGQAMYDALAPELSGLATAHKNISGQSMFAPRGSGQVSRQSELDTGYLKGIGDIIGKARPESAAALGSIANLLYGLTTGFASASQGQTGTIGNLLNQFKATNLNERGFRTQQAQEGVKFFGSILGGI